MQAEFSKKALASIEPFLRTAFAADLDPILQEVPSPEEEFQELLKLFALHPDWSQIVVQYVQGIRKSQEPIPFENVIRFFGLQNARAFLIAYRLAEVFPAKLLARGKEGLALAQPISSLIRFAPLTLIRFGEDSRYKQVAYASGLLFDLLYLHLAESVEGQGGLKKLAETLGAFHEKACKDAAFAIELARFRKKLPLEKHIVTVTLVGAATRAAMALLYPDFLATWASFDKAGLPNSGRIFIERQRFGGVHSMFASALGGVFAVLEGALPALRCLSMPSAQLDPKVADSRDLASVVLVAKRLSERKNPSYDGQGIFKAAAYRPELAGFQLEIPQKDLDPLIRKLS